MMKRWKKCEVDASYIDTNKINIYAGCDTDLWPAAFVMNGLGDKVLDSWNSSKFQQPIPTMQQINYRCLNIIIIIIMYYNC